MSIYPSVRLHSFYSIDFSDSVQILFEHLSLVDIPSLFDAIRNKKYDNVCIVKDKMYINTVNQVISIEGTAITDGRYMISAGQYGKTLHIPYTCSHQTIIDGIQLLYHMYHNWANDN